MATTKTREESYGSISSNVEVLKDKKILQYPIGLGSTEFDDHGKEQQYMMFKINTNEKTTSLRGDKQIGDVTTAVGTRNGIRTTSGGAGIFDKSADPDVSIKYSNEDKTKWVKQKGMVRLDKVIILPMPNDHNVNTSLEYTKLKQNLLTQAGDMLNQQGSDLVSAGVTKFKNWLGAAGVNALKSGATSEEALLAEDGLLSNSKMEVRFTGFTFRKFSFSYQFAPKSQAESEIVRDIIETFRYYALPELTLGSMYYIMPSEFEIYFMQGQRDNPNIPKVTTSVLENVSVNYSPNSVWSTLPNGANLAINMTLNFVELELVDRSRVYNPESLITSGY